MRFSSSVIAVAGILSCGIPALGQSAAAGNLLPQREFPFVMPWDDSTRGTVTDLSYLNAKPAGVNGRIVVRNGHFAEEKTGLRIRFLGVCFDDASAFPSHSDAEKVAARAAKLGINIVRLSGLDNSGWGPNTNLWTTDLRHFDPVQIDKLDYLVAQFKKNGIYIDIPLQMCRNFQAADGVPTTVSAIPFSFQARVDEYDRAMIGLEKSYAAQLLTHVNPYTHLSYADDPCLATVEITNENSLVGFPWGGMFGSGLGSLPEPFLGELKQRWNGWLAAKYASDDRLRSAWLLGTTPVGPSLLGPTQNWVLEQHGSAVVTELPGTAGDQQELPGTAKSLGVSVHSADGTVWHAQVNLTGLDFKPGDDYTVTFEARADTPRTIPVDTLLDESDWHNVGMNYSADLTPDWKQFSTVFTAHDTVAGHCRISFLLGDRSGSLWIRGLTVAPGDAGAGLQSGESLTNKSVDLPVALTSEQQHDWITFLADTERDYSMEMRDYLTGALHVHACIIGSQLDFGGVTSLNRESSMDYADIHSYWQHPSFPHQPWDPRDWNIANSSMVSDLAKGGPGSLRLLALYRIADRPYTVSEYNHPAPSDFQAEALPVLSSFAALQDWDAIYLYEYGKYGTGAPNDTMDGYFGVGANPAKTAFYPTAALMFRAGLVHRLAKEVVLPLTPSQLITVNEISEMWKRAGEISIFKERTAVGLNGDKRAPADPPSQPTENVTISQDGGGQYRIDGDYAVLAAGFLGGESVRFRAARFDLPPFGDNYAVITLVPADRKPVSRSSRLLLTLIGKVENQDMVWNDSRTSVGNQWGHGPTMAEGIPATVVLATDGPRRVYSLDGTGKHKGRVAASYSAGKLTFCVGPDCQTVWYEIDSLKP